MFKKEKKNSDQAFDRHLPLSVNSETKLRCTDKKKGNTLVHSLSVDA